MVRNLKLLILLKKGKEKLTINFQMKMLRTSFLNRFNKSLKKEKIYLNIKIHKQKKDLIQLWSSNK